MMPLYAAWVQDLGPDDVAVFRCGAWGHTAELPPSALIHGLALQPGFGGVIRGHGGHGHGRNG